MFVRDRQTGTTERMSVDGAGNPANGYSFNPTISADGRFVAFDSSATNLGDTTGVFVHDRQTGATQGVRVGSDPALSADGRVVAFSSAASDLVPGDTNGQWDVFVQGGIADPQPLRTNGQPRPSGTFRAGTTEVTLSITTYSCRGTPTGTRTCSSATGRPAPSSG